MLATVIVCVFLTVCFLTVCVLNIIFRNRLHVQARIKSFVHSSEKANERLEGSFAERIIKPVLGRANSFLDRVTPKYYYNQLERRIREAGSPKGISVGGVVFFQICFTLASAAAALWLAMYAPPAKVVILFMSMIGIINMLPKYYLKHKIVERQKEIERSLPDVLDLLTVSIEAGLSFDGAVAKLVEKMSGVLVEEFSLVLKEMRVGVSKRDAFKALVERVPVPSLVTFVGSIIQADQLGVSIGNVLRIQSSLVRQKRRQKTQENAMKAPIKMLLPMIIFIMPTIFIVILGPMLIQFIQAFSK